MNDLFGGLRSFRGLPVDGFAAFDVPDRAARRRTIIERIHPALERLGDDLVTALQPRVAARAGGGPTLNAHLPRLDWPRGYDPFCTWLAISALPAGYQAGPQLNVGVHRDHVAVRLGWDTAADGFGRFEFLARYGDLGRDLERIAGGGLRFRVHGRAPWPEGSRVLYESRYDAAESFEVARRAGHWWEFGRRWELPAAQSLVGSPEFGGHVERVMVALLPMVFRTGGRSSTAETNEPRRRTA